jgi:hypothetical protein
MKKTASLLAIPALLLAFAGSARADAPNPHEIFIKDIILGGTGCPADSADLRLSSDGTRFSLGFGEEFTARLRSGVPISESRKNCQLSVTFHIPQGFTFAVGSVDYRGSAEIARGASGQHRAAYYFQGQEEQVATTRTLAGGFDGDFHFRDEVVAAALVFAPCGVERALNINTSVLLKKGTSSSASRSTMSLDSERGRIDTIFNFHWKRCTD